MKCEIHQTNPRPDVCHDCARMPLAEAPMKLRLQDTDTGSLVRQKTTDARGKERVSYISVGNIRMPDNSCPWAQTWD